MKSSRQVMLTGQLGMLCAAALAGSTLVACSATPGKLSGGSGLCSDTNQVDGLTVKRDSALPHNHEHFNFAATVTVSATGKARSVASAVCELPQMPAKPIACGNDAGITYELTFTAKDMKLPAITLRASGCENVLGLGETRWALRSPEFWHVLGIAMGLKHPSQSTFAGSMV
jgi:hypothetical protein